MHKNEKAIVATLCYSDIFDYPLTREEIEKFLVSPSSLRVPPRREEAISLLLQQDKIIHQDSLYALPGRKVLFSLRKKRQEISQKKLQKVKQVISLFAKIPTVRMLGISGSLAMGNAKEDDDIDLFLITQKGTLWITRLLVLVFLQIFGMRRQRHEKKAPNKVCVNLMLDESVLKLPISSHNLYGAHEVVQMKVVVNKNNTYEKFMHANIWVKECLPNALSVIAIRQPAEKQSHSKLRHPRLDSGSLFFSFLERLSKRLQLSYMQSHITSEIITDTLLAFHPFNYKNKILKEYNKRVKKYV